VGLHSRASARNLALLCALAACAASLACKSKPAPSSSSAAAAASLADASVGAVDAASDSTALASPDGAPDTAPEANAPPDPNAGRCPSDMKYVSGEYCKALRHKCVKGRDDKKHVRCPEGCYLDPRECQEWLPGSAECLGTKYVYKNGKESYVPEYSHLEFCMDDAEWPNKPGEKPTVFIDYFQAQKMCASVGKRVCTSAEFTLACEGPEHLPTATGWKIDGSVCNVDKEWRDWHRVNLTTKEGFAKIDQSEPVGSRATCVSPYGVHDLTGNVDEWTTLDKIDHAMTDHPAQLKGGYYAQGAHPFCRAHTDFHPPDFSFYQIGTRCCSAPTPAAGAAASASASASASAAH
jgi:hypothetical protein